MPSSTASGKDCVNRADVQPSPTPKDPDPDDPALVNISVLDTKMATSPLIDFLIEHKMVSIKHKVDLDNGARHEGEDPNDES